MMFENYRGIYEKTLLVLRKRRDYIAFSTLLFLYCIFAYVAYIMNSGVLPYLHDTPLYRAFEDPLLIYFGITVNISTSIPTVMDLLMDSKSYRDLSFEDEIVADNDSWIERFFLAALSIVPGVVVLLFRGDVNIPYIYVIVHSIQTLGSVGMVLLICKKQEQKHFTSIGIINTMIISTLTMATSILGFGHGILYPPNILTYVLMICGSYFLLGKFMFPWMRDVWVQSISKRKPLSIRESCVMWYFMNTMIILMLIHTAVGAFKYCLWTSYDYLDINVFVFSFAFYSVINSTVPGRLARIAVEEKKAMVQVKQSLIRYLTHELRSPLNAIHSGLNVLVDDMESLPASEQKKEVMEIFNSIRHASGDLLHTMNDLQLLETIDSATFSIEEKMVPCANLTQIAEKCESVCRENGVAFFVNNQFQRREPPSACGDNILAFSDISAEEQPDLCGPATDLVLFIDEYKVGVVLRNLISHSVKSTPVGRSISVNIREVTSSDPPELEDGDEGETENDEVEISDRRTRALSFAQESGYALWGQVLVEVIDTGVGIALKFR